MENKKKFLKRVLSERLQSKSLQRLESFGMIGREGERKRSCGDAPDQEVANEVLNVSESSPGSDIEVSSVKLVFNPSDGSDDVNIVVI